MSAELAVEFEPDWFVPPAGGFTADDLDRLPDLPPHTELIDGSLVFVSPRKMFHTWMNSLLDLKLFAQAPRHLQVCREMSVTLGKKQRPEPDVLVVDTGAVTDLDQGTVLPSSVMLAIEVVSPESEERDRIRKPELYAQAGIPHFWRVENEDGKPVIYVYELDPANSAYMLTGVHHDRLKLSEPFDIDIDLTAVDRR